MTGRTLNAVGWILLLAGAAGIFGAIALSPRRFLRDFVTYYHASQVFSRGGNPYGTEASPDTAEPAPGLKFVYPPHILPLFSWTAGLAYNRARLAWLIAKGVFLLALLLCWRRILAHEHPDVLFFAFAALAFNSAIVIDLTAGNVAIIEQALLWGGFLAFTRERWTTFALLVAASALFKLNNGLFILLLLPAPSRRAVLPLAAGVAAIASPLVVSCLLWPRLFDSFLMNANGLMFPGERGASNPCLWACLSDMRDTLVSLTGLQIPSVAVGILFALHALVILSVTGKIMRRLFSSAWEERYVCAVALACLAFPLVVPRFKDYSFIQLIPPAYLLLRRAGTGRFEVALLAFILCMPTVSASRLLDPLLVYHLLFVTYGLWLLLLLYVKTGVAEFGDMHRAA